MTTKGIYHTLVTQLDKLARHNRQGSFRTKDRYYEAVKRFCAYLAAHYHLQKLENISGKHLVSYVLYLQEQGKSASTIKTDLSAIRYPLSASSTIRCPIPVMRCRATKNWALPWNAAASGSRIVHGRTRSSAS